MFVKVSVACLDVYAMVFVELSQSLQETITLWERRWTQRTAIHITAAGTKRVRVISWKYVRNPNLIRINQTGKRQTAWYRNCRKLLPKKIWKNVRVNNNRDIINLKISRAYHVITRTQSSPKKGLQSINSNIHPRSLQWTRSGWRPFAWHLSTPQQYKLTLICECIKGVV